MKRELLKRKILKVICGMRLASLATIKDKKPWVRFVVSYNDDLTLYISTYASSRKVKQIEKNPNVHVTIGGSLENLKAPYVQISGCATIRNDAGIRRKCWHKYMKEYYSGPDDPGYVVIEVKPQIIEYMDSETHKPIIYKTR
jgi:general stress protein 26